MSEYWGFHDYNTISHPHAPQKITSYPTTVKRVSSTAYTVTSKIDGAGALSISLLQKPWGTYNLGNWCLVTENGQTHTFTDDSTDMEYVHQYYYSENSITWSGGNHGGEALESIAFYNAETGEEIGLSEIGSTATVNALHVIEKTKLLHFPDADGDSINDYNCSDMAYTENDVYAKLTRKYTFTGPQIQLNVDYVYTRDSYHDRIYACMFPVSKTYGCYCDMIDTNGDIIQTVATRPYGDTSIADYTGAQNSGNAAVRALVYGTKYPEYRFDIRVNTVKDSLNDFQNASYKTSFWDMNRYNNKLYFSRFDKGKRVLHKKGKELHTECIWLFQCQVE